MKTQRFGTPPTIPKAVLMLTLSIFGMGAPVVSAQAAPRTAVFPFELLDTAQEGELFPKVRPEETNRLALLTDDLKARLSTLKRHEIVATDSIADDIKKASPLHRCNGCEVDLAKKVGAKLAIVGVVQKFSDTLLSVTLQTVDSDSGRVVSIYNAGIQGNTDEAWLRGVSYIVRNRIATEDGPK